MGDLELLREYAARGSEPAFAALVQRHVNLVYSVALRRVGNPHQAEEIAQAVFIILARKAGAFRDGTTLSSWLFQTTRLTASNFLRTENRRQRREQEAYMQSRLVETESEDWRRMAPLLDDAIASLGEKDRSAIMLRFIEGRPMREVGAALGASENSAKMRVSRAVEKLRGFFSKRGVTLSAATIAGALTSHAVQAAPATLPTVIVGAAAVKGTAAATSTATLIKGTLKLMAWTKLKTAVIAGAGVLLVAGTATITVTQIVQAREQAQEDEAWNIVTTNALKNLGSMSLLLEKMPPTASIRPTRLTLTGYGNLTTADERFMGINQPLPWLLKSAYDLEDCRIIKSTPLPAGNFDYFANRAGHGREDLQRELGVKLGLRGRRVMLETNVFILSVKDPKTPGLKPGLSLPNPAQMQMHGRYTWVNHPLSTFTRYLEGQLGTPVINRTGLSGNFDIDLRWGEPDAPVDPEALRKAVLDQLGLDLAPGRESVEMVVIEKVK